MSIKNAAKPSTSTKPDMSKGPNAKMQVDAKQDISKVQGKPVQPKVASKVKPETDISTQKPGNVEKKPAEILKTGKIDGARDSTKPTEEFLFCFKNIRQASGACASFYSSGVIEVKFAGGTIVKGDRANIEKQFKSEKKDQSAADVELLQKIVETCTLVQTKLYNEEQKSQPVSSVNLHVQQQVKPELSPQYSAQQPYVPTPRPQTYENAYKKSNQRGPFPGNRTGHKASEYQQDYRRSSYNGYELGGQALAYQQGDMQYAQGQGRNPNMQQTDGQVVYNRQRRSSASSQPHYGGSRVQQVDGSGGFATDGYVQPAQTWNYPQPNQAPYYHAQQPYYAPPVPSYATAYPTQVYSPVQHFSQVPDGSAQADFYAQQYSPAYHQG